MMESIAKLTELMLKAETYEMPEQTQFHEMDLLLNREQIHDYLQTHKNEIIEELKNLVKIPSEQGQAEEYSPFGKDCAHLLKEIQALYSANGFETELDERGGYLLSYYGQGEKSIGLFAHADVVAVGEDWLYTKPFEPIERDGFLIGRGVLDDKSAVIMSLYILKLIKDLGIPFKRRIVCFTGVNEETGMLDIQNYLAKHKPPDFSLVADTAFPLYRGNKGILRCEIKANSPLEDILYIQGGNAVNIVLGQAEMALRFTDERYRWLNERITNRIKLHIEKDKIILRATGISKHGALPEGSLNAGWVLADLLKDCPHICESDKNQMHVLSCVLSDIYGENLGIANEDPDFGKLTCSNGIIKTENKKISFTLDMRVGKTVNLENVKETLRKNFLAKHFNIEFFMERPASVTEEDNPYIEICLNTYKKYTGDENARTRINAGGTYARHLPCAAEIGTTTIWGTPTKMPCGHGRAHQPDECISINGFLEAIELTALMVLACDKKE